MEGAYIATRQRVNASQMVAAVPPLAQVHQLSAPE